MSAIGRDIASIREFLRTTSMRGLTPDDIEIMGVTVRRATFVLAYLTRHGHVPAGAVWGS